MHAVRLAVIGCGRWGPNHIRILGSLPSARVVAYADTDRAARSRMARQFPGIAAVSAEAALRDPAIDALVVATPAATHYGLVRRALMAGKHVLCEKPLCRTSRQATALASLARRKRRVLMVGHVFLFNSGLLRLKKTVDSGRLGRILSISAIRTNLGPVRSDVNVAYDLASHDIAICNWLMGAIPRRVSATGVALLQSGIADETSLTLDYAGGASADLHASWLFHRKIRRMTVVGERRTASWDDQDAKSADAEPLKAQARAFLIALRSGKPERSGPEFSAGVVGVLEAAEKSVKQRGRTVKIQRPR